MTVSFSRVHALGRERSAVLGDCPYFRQQQTALQWNDPHGSQPNAARRHPGCQVRIQILFSLFVSIICFLVSNFMFICSLVFFLFLLVLIVRCDALLLERGDHAVFYQSAFHEGMFGIIAMNDTVGNSMRLIGKTKGRMS